MTTKNDIQDNTECKHVIATLSMPPVCDLCGELWSEIMNEKRKTNIQELRDWEAEFDKRWAEIYMSEKSFEEFRQFLKKLVMNLLFQELSKQRVQILQQIEDMGVVTESSLFVDGQDWKEYKEAIKEGNDLFAYNSHSK